MRTVQRQNGRAVAGGELQGSVASMLTGGDLSWKLHGMNYGEAREFVRHMSGCVFPGFS